MVRYLKRLKSSKFVCVKAFPMYGGMGVSAPSLHRESTDSLIPSHSSRLSPFNIIMILYGMSSSESLEPILLSKA